MQESAAGAYDRASDAYDRGNRLPGHFAAGRGGDGAGEGSALFRHGGKGRVPYAVQCDHNGDHMAYGCHKGCAFTEKAAGYCECAAEGICFPELSPLP